MDLSLILFLYYLLEWRKQFFVNVAVLSISSYTVNHAYHDIEPDVMPEEESTVFRPDVIIRSGNLVMEISNTASEELVQKIRGRFHV